MSSDDKRCSSGVTPTTRTQSFGALKQVSTLSRSKTCGFTGSTALKPKVERLQPLATTNRSSPLNDEPLPDEVHKLHPAMVNELCLHAKGLSTIPNLSQFSKLQMLDLSCNNLTHIDNLRALTNLRELKLYGNKLEQIENLECLTQLQILQLQFNEIEKIGSSLVYLIRLQSLRIDSNKLSLIRSEEISKLSQLKILDISDCPIETLDFINTLPSITELRASHCCLKILPNPLRSFRYLNDLDLSDNELMNITSLKTLSSLRILHLANNRIQDIQIISTLVQLHELHLSNNQINSVPNSFQKLIELQCLNLANNRILSWKDIDVLSRMNALFILHINGNPFLSEEEHSREKLAKLCPSLEIIDDVSVKNGDLKIPPTESYEQLMNIDKELTDIDRTLEKSIADVQEQYETIMSDLQKLSEWYTDGNNEQQPSNDRSTDINKKSKYRLFQALTFGEENYSNSNDKRTHV